MKVLACLLTVIVFLRHAGDVSLADMTGIGQKVVYYILGGFQETILWVAVGLLAYTQKPSVWRSMLFGACTIGVIEGFQIPACRLLAMNKQYTGNLCDSVTGLPVGVTMLAVYMVAFTLFFRKYAISFIRLLVSIIAGAGIAFTVGPFAGFIMLVICLAI